MEGGNKKCHLCIFFSADLARRFASSWGGGGGGGGCVLGHPIARATGYCLLPDTF